MTIEEFKAFKERRLSKISATACSPALDKAIAADTPEDYLQVIVDNIYWLHREKMITADDLLEFGDDLLMSKGVYVRKSNLTVKDQPAVLFYDSSSVKAYGSSSVEAYDSSSVKAYDSSSVKAYGSSSVKAYDSSSVKAYGSSSVEAYDSSSVKAYDSSSVEAYDSSSVKAYDSSSVLEGRFSTPKIQLLSDLTFIRKIGENKIYIKKGKFEIIEME